jgi:HEAT repeat protein
MTSLERIRDIAAREHADPDDLAFLCHALGAATKAEQRGAAEAVAVVARAGIAVEPLLERALADADPRRRWGAVYAWSRLGPVPPACLPVLLDALGAADGDLRWAAAAIVREIGARPEVRAALRALLHAASGLQRKMALYCLRDLGRRDGDLEREILAALDDPDPAVRLAAMSALAQLAGDRRAAARAVALRLDDAEAGVARAAAAALGRLGEADTQVVDALRRARAAGDPALTRAAGRALSALGRA